MDALQYLWPDNPIARLIVKLLSWMFALWVFGLVGCWIRLQRQKRQMQRGEDVHTLVTALQTWSVKKEKAADETVGTLPSTSEANAAFHAFCLEHNIKSLRPIVKEPRQESSVARHIKAIFEAGWTDSRLEAGELIRHTTNRLFQMNGFLRSVLAVFIVFGLLGTLFGLADSLSQLSPLDSARAPQSTEMLSQGLSHLLIQLKSAFAPSILGILFTIVGVILFNLYLQLACAPVRNTLERLTLTVWIPKLFPTTSQRMVKTLQLSEQQMQKSFEAAEKVADFSEEIQSEAGDLKQGLKGANKALTSLTRASNDISLFSKQFVDAVGHLVPFQTELGVLYKQMVEESKTFHKSVHDNIVRSEAFQTNAQQILNKQHERLEELLSALDSYEKAYLRTREQIDARIEEVLVSAKKAFDDIGNRNTELVEAVGKPLRDELTKDLGEIEQTLRVQLQGIQDRFGKFDTPIKEAADKISRILTTTDKRGEEIAKELQREILKQDEKNREQTQQLGALNEQIAVLLKELSDSRKFQADQTKELGDNLGSLARNFDSFGTSIVGLGQSFNLTGHHLKQLERLEAQSNLIVDAFSRMAKSSQSQSDQIQTLIRDVGRVEEQVGFLSSRIASLRPVPVSARPHFDQTGRSGDKDIPRTGSVGEPFSGDGPPSGQARRPDQHMSVESPNSQPESSTQGVPIHERTPDHLAAPRQYTIVTGKKESGEGTSSNEKQKSWFRRVTGRLPFIGDR